MSFQEPIASQVYETIALRVTQSACYLKLNRPQANNTINWKMILEMHHALDSLVSADSSVLVIEGLPETFCTGADFSEFASAPATFAPEDQGAQLYHLWQKIAELPLVTIAHVKGKVNAGGVGFVAATDIAIADSEATFSLSELLFGLMPACVMPFLVRRIGPQRAKYMTLMTKPFSAAQVCDWGLVDVCADNSDAEVRKHLLRSGRLSRKSVGRYKTFMKTVSPGLDEYKEIAIAANRQVFTDDENRVAISRFVNEGKFPWED